MKNNTKQHKSEADLQWEQWYRQMLSTRQRCVPSEKELVDALHLVMSLAARHVGKGLTFRELVSAGNFGLAVALDKYNPKRNKCFLPFAKLFIEGYILNEFRNNLSFTLLDN